VTFFVLGLPRSRTAWLANFLTYDDLFCYHEGINGCHSMDEYKQKIENCGDSCTGLSLIDFEPYFPDAKKVIIDSNTERAVEFGKTMFDADLTELMAIAKSRLDNMEGLHISLSDINHRLREIWEYLTDSPFNKKRADQLIKLNIQTENIYDIDVKAMLNLKESVTSCLG